jgi:hypothetical protein
VEVIALAPPVAVSTISWYGISDSLDRGSPSADHQGLTGQDLGVLLLDRRRTATSR